MYYTGFADESVSRSGRPDQGDEGAGLDCIESRNIDGVNIHELSEGIL